MNRPGIPGTVAEGQSLPILPGAEIPQLNLYCSNNDYQYFPPNSPEMATVTKLRTIHDLFLFHP
jgi:hypothetical protein